MQPRTLEQMQYCRTRYEVELIAGGNRRVVGYTARKTQDALYEYARQHGDEILRVLGNPEDVWFTKFADEISINDEISIRFTGRTEREARMAIDAVAQIGGAHAVAAQMQRGEAENKKLMAGAA